jgi:hypothetical protein
LEFLSQDAAARMEYEALMKTLSDEKSRIEGARLEGKRLKAEEMARELLALGVDISVISKASKLSEQDISKFMPLQ